MPAFGMLKLQEFNFGNVCGNVPDDLYSELFVYL